MASAGFDLDLEEMRHRGAVVRDPYPLFQRFGAGIWSMVDLGRVLLASHPERERARGRVATAIRTNGPAAYAVLAGLILEAHLFGIRSEDAVFDEATPFPAPPQPKAPKGVQ